MGRVIFVSAGPGAADLITLRGARALAQAEFVEGGRLAAVLFPAGGLGGLFGTQKVFERLPQGAERRGFVPAAGAHGGQHVLRAAAGAGLLDDPLPQGGRDGL